MFCESFCMEKMYVRSRSAATASRSREAGLIMGHSETDDINKWQRSFAVIVTIFIDSCQMEIICSSRALFNPASRDFASRVLKFFNSLGRKTSLPLKKLLPSWSETHFWPWRPKVVGFCL